MHAHRAQGSLPSPDVTLKRETAMWFRQCFRPQLSFGPLQSKGRDEYSFPGERGVREEFGKIPSRKSIETCQLISLLCDLGLFPQPMSMQ